MNFPGTRKCMFTGLDEQGRAGKKGLALSLCTQQELNRVKAIEEYQNPRPSRMKRRPFKCATSTGLSRRW
jgi:superfamily II DNA/RNA helicase